MAPWVLDDYVWGRCIHPGRAPVGKKLPYLKIILSSVCEITPLAFNLAFEKIFEVFFCNHSQKLVHHLKILYRLWVGIFLICERYNEFFYRSEIARAKSWHRAWKQLSAVVCNKIKTMALSLSWRWKMDASKSFDKSLNSLH